MLKKLSSHAFFIIKSLEFLCYENLVHMQMNKTWQQRLTFKLAIILHITIIIAIKQLFNINLPIFI